MSIQQIVKPEAIEERLKEIWERLGQENKMRACLFNLIVFNRYSERTDYIRSIVQKVIDKFPCRVLFISEDPNPQEPYLKTAVSVIMAEGAESSIACDHIDIGVGGTGDAVLVTSEGSGVLDPQAARAADVAAIAPVPMRNRRRVIMARRPWPPDRPRRPCLPCLPRLPSRPGLPRRREGPRSRTARCRHARSRALRRPRPPGVRKETAETAAGRHLAGSPRATNGPGRPR